MGNCPLQQEIAGCGRYFIAVLANGMCLKYVDYDTVLWLRFLAGFGSGIYTAVAMTVFGMSIRPALAYNLMLFSFAFSQALEMRILPQLSMNGIYWVFIVCFLLTLPFLGWIRATQSQDLSLQKHRKQIPADHLNLFWHGFVFLQYFSHTSTLVPTGHI